MLLPDRREQGIGEEGGVGLAEGGVGGEDDGLGGAVGEEVRLGEAGVQFDLWKRDG